MKEKKKPLIIGGIGGLIAILCCVSPVVLVLFGLSTATAAIALGDTLFNDYKFYFIGASLLFMAGSFTLYLKKKNQCSLSGVRKNINLIISALIMAMIVYVFFFLLTSWLESVFG